MRTTLQMELLTREVTTGKDLFRHNPQDVEVLAQGDLALPMGAEKTLTEVELCPEEITNIGAMLGMGAGTFLSAVLSFQEMISPGYEINSAIWTLPGTLIPVALLGAVSGYITGRHVELRQYLRNAKRLNGKKTRVRDALPSRNEKREVVALKRHGEEPAVNVAIIRKGFKVWVEALEYKEPLVTWDENIETVKAVYKIKPGKIKALAN